MNRLTQTDDQGNWSLKGVPWMMLYVGVPITEKVSEKLYGALYKLKDYEDTGLAPAQIWEMNELYREKCEEVNRLKVELAAERKKHKNATENSSILQKIEEMSYPSEGIGCGLEDVGITDRYEAAAYGWNEAVERIAEIIRSHMPGCVLAWKKLPEPYRPKED